MHSMQASKPAAVAIDINTVVAYGLMFKRLAQHPASSPDYQHQNRVPAGSTLSFADKISGTPTLARVFSLHMALAWQISQVAQLAVYSFQQVTLTMINQIQPQGE